MDVQWMVFIAIVAIGWAFGKTLDKILSVLVALREETAQSTGRIKDLIDGTRNDMLSISYELHMIRRILEEKTGMTAASVKDIDSRAADERLKQLAARIDKRD